MCPLLFGHRGVRGVRGVRENTFAAFDLALQHGCHGFEFDVRMNADRHGLVCHGPRFKGISIARTTGARLNELPRLETVLERYGSRAFLDIELKVAGLEAAVLELL